MVEESGEYKSKIRSLLAAGRLAKVKRYQNLLLKIKSGESLTAAEIKDLERLEREIESDIDKPDKIKTIRAAAEYCGVSKSVIGRQVKAGKLRRKSDRTFYKSELDQLKKSAQVKKPESSLQIQKEEAELRWRQARALREELLVKQLKKDLIAKEKMIERMVRLSQVFISALSVYEDRLPPLLEGKNKVTMRKIIHEENKILRKNLIAR